MSQSDSVANPDASSHLGQPSTDAEREVKNRKEILVWFMDRHGDTCEAVVCLELFMTIEQ
jgi:hypothetical protein